MITAEQLQLFAHEGYSRVPLYRELMADLDTPLSVYLKLAQGPYSFLFESFEQAEKWGRYSIVGLPCSTVIKVQAHHITLEHKGVPVEQVSTADPLAWIADFQQQFSVPTLPQLPAFIGGLVGYFSYDTARYIEPRLGPCILPDSLQTPDILLMVTDELVIFDNLKNKLFLVVYADPRESASVTAANQRLDELITQLNTREVHLPSPTVTATATQPAATANITQQTFEQRVEQAKEYVLAGDIMQVILSQRWQMPFTCNPLQLYRVLKHCNPSPYLYYLNIDNFYVIGASPEILVRVQDDEVTVRPLAGTRPRGKTPEEDIQLEHDLCADTKECAEHAMLIDLGRNDIGRVSTIGSVKLTEKMAVERYSHVMHLVSNVTGRLKPGLHAIDALRATFPAGTLTGAAKVRAMEIIDALETEKRGIYGGAVGYLAWNGNMDLAIAIRTAVVKDNTLFVQAGAGIVADSVPEREWEETRNKARAILVAAALAQAEESSQ